MNETQQKPFACTISGCQMAFTSEDHLNWHQKKHDMALNLEIESGKSNDIADQTPTPTRFIRNCEEVGLFQDLQNVNPFDETFKKAFETVKSGASLVVPEAVDDTLHTPHILPHVVDQERSKRTNESEDVRSNQSSEDFCIDSVPPPIHGQDFNHELLKVLKKNNGISLNQVSDDNSSLMKSRLKDAIIIKKEKSKQNQKIINKKVTGSGAISTTKPLKKIYFPSAIVQSKSRRQHQDSVSKAAQIKLVQNERDKTREMNRAAQLRCRKRKQIQQTKMEHELTSLKTENRKLFNDNQSLRHKIAALKEMLLNHKHCDIMSSADATINADTIDVILKNKLEEYRRAARPSLSQQQQQQQQIVPVNNRRRPIQPLSSIKLLGSEQIGNLLVSPHQQVVPVIQSVTPDNNKTMFFQIVGATPLAVTVLPSHLKK